ncbi:MAG: pyridoxal phosphate-dependent aminotransferase [Candidatus Aenigmarchaeota archaeon]|nr:pyridoxal phosphate-dependent aminotransferase [Candidatus Aenigmarchaeota archaeon]
MRPNYDYKGRSQTIIRKIISDMPPGTISLARGDPEKPKRDMIEEFYGYINEVDNGGYAPTCGSDYSRKVFSKHYKERHDIDIPKENFCIMDGGASRALFSIFVSYLEDGDTVLLPDVTFLLYEGQIKSISDMMPEGIKVGYVKTNPDFSLDEEDLKKKVEKEKPKMFVFATPNNPTGTRYGEEELKLISDLSNDYEFGIVSDEVYDELIFDGRKHHSILSYDDNAIQVNSASKKFMPDLRLGWISSKNGERIKELLPKVQIINPSAPSSVVHAYARSLENGLIKRYTDDVLPRYKKNVNHLSDELEDLGFKVQKPDSTFYVFPKLPDNIDDMKFSDVLIKNGVAGVPGSAFGPGGKRHMRFSCGNATIDELDEAIKRIKKSLKVYK